MGKFVIYNAASGVNFHLKAANGETIGTSQVYVSKSTCMTGIESVMHTAPIAHREDQTVAGFEPAKFPKFEVYVDQSGEKFRFRLMASNGEEILASQAYTAKASCMNGIESVIENAPTAEIEEAE